MNLVTSATILLLGWIARNSEGFSPSVVATTGQYNHAINRVRGGQSSGSTRAAVVIVKSSRQDDDDEQPENAAAAFPIPTTSQIVQKVAVAGATGRTGKLVVEELLRRNVQVVAMVRNVEKAQDVFCNVTSSSLEIQQVDLTNSDAIAKALEGCDAVIWSATGFSDSPAIGIVEKFKRLFGIALAPKQSIDAVGVPTMAKIMLDQVGNSSKTSIAGAVRQAYPKVVMLSSAGVTRPSWDDAKREKLRGCAEIPIVRLNPFGILDVKRESEQKLRETGVNYCIVRPGGLNDNWPEGARPVVSQGDVAVGRINRKDVAKVLCDVLTLPEACDKTFEVIGLAGYPTPREIGPALARLKTDSEGITETEVEATYGLMQQLLPGERQDAAALAMGQSYEQLDKGETGRLGERGKEDAEAAAPKPTNV